MQLRQRGRNAIKPSELQRRSAKATEIDVTEPPRLLITGGPGTGKTTLAREIAALDGRRRLCSDPQNLCPDGTDGTPSGMTWSEVSEFLAAPGGWLDQPGPWVIEGVAVPRALRKWLAREGFDAPPPCDRLVVLTTPFAEQTRGQQVMGDALMGVLDELLDWLAPVLEYRELVYRPRGER